MRVERLFQTTDPKPKPPITIPEVRPGCFGNQSQEWWTGTMYAKPELNDWAKAQRKKNVPKSSVAEATRRSMPEISEVPKIISLGLMFR